MAHEQGDSSSNVQMERIEEGPQRRASLRSWQRYMAIGLLAASGLPLLVYALSIIARNNAGVDYYYHFYPMGRAWLNGQLQLYDPSNPGFYEPPWTIWLIGLFALLPYPVGLAVLWTLSLAVIIASVFIFSLPGHGRPWALAFTLFNLHTFDVMWRGQIDAFNLLGVTLGWVGLGQRSPLVLGVAYCMLMIKPPNTIPLALYLLWRSWQTWSKREVILSLTLPVLIILSSLLVFPDWPSRAFNYYLSVPPDNFNEGGWHWLTTLWRVRSQLALPPVFPAIMVALTVLTTVWLLLKISRRIQRDERQDVLDSICLILAATFIVTPYALSYHYVILLAVVIPYLADRLLWINLILYLLTFLPVLRLWVGVGSAWLDMLLIISSYVIIGININTGVLTRLSEPSPSVSEGQINLRVKR